MNLLIVDTETTGLDPETDQVIELAAVLYSIPHQTVLHQVSTLLYAESNPAEKVNRIAPNTLKMVKEKLQQQSIELFMHLVNHAMCLVAHNAEFDRQWFNGKQLPELYNRHGKPKDWLCTMEDFTFPKQSKPNSSLISLALDHGVTVCSAHRALTDCHLIASIFDRLSSSEINDVVIDAINSASTPKFLYIAEVSYENRDLAKAAGFRWNDKTKKWSKKMSESAVKQLPFFTTKVIG